MRRPCKECGRSIATLANAYPRSDALYCSNACRQRAWRRRTGKRGGHGGAVYSRTFRDGSRNATSPTVTLQNRKLKTEN